MLVRLGSWPLIRKALFKAGRFARILGGLHFPVLVIWQGVVVRVLWRARAEQEGEEEEGHFSSCLHGSKTNKPRDQTPETVTSVPPLLFTIVGARVQKPTRSATA